MRHLSQSYMVEREMNSEAGESRSWTKAEPWDSHRLVLSVAKNRCLRGLVKNAEISTTSETGQENGLLGQLTISFMRLVTFIVASVWLPVNQLFYRTSSLPSSPNPPKSLDKMAWIKAFLLRNPRVGLIFLSETWLFN